MRAVAIPALLVCFLFSPLAAQRGPLSPQGSASVPATGPTITGLVIPAIRIQGDEPVIDGFLSDEVWLTAPVASDFTQMEPNEGESPTERTEVRVLYGSGALFVAFRAYDSQPEEIAAQLTRRDSDSYSDKVHILIDSYFDRRTAFHFGVNPVGVKVDLYRFNDTEEDSSWDAVWDVATRIDDQGWTAEFRIPYSQLRFGNHDDQTWGINFAREIARRNETSTWAPIRQSDAAVVSKSGELRGLKDLGTPTRMELRPFTLARLAQGPGDPDDPFYKQNDFFSSAGLDLKYGVTNDLTIDVTVNPDFGQVEADPAQVNLSAFETFNPEQRPFFIEGASIYNFGIGIGDGELGSESLFYSRRIGRSPQGSADPQGGFSDAPDMSTILGAWKLSGKTQGGWSIGLLHAITAEENAQVAPGDGIRLEDPVEPRSNYGVARVQKDFREGKSALGFIGTAATRNKEVADALDLRTGGYAGGFDFRHRFGADDRYLMNGYLLGSHVTGSEGAIERTQRSPSRYFQRPDADHTDYDPTLTSLNGWAGKLEFLKVAGGFWNWGTTAIAKSPGFEPNDLGFQRESDLILHAGFIGYNHHTPSERLRRWNLNVNGWHGWSFGGERLATGGNINGSLTFPNYWGGYLGINHDFEAFSNGSLRGGPLVRRVASTNGWLGLFTDSRKAIQANLSNNWSRSSESDSWSWNSSVTISGRPSGRMNMSLGPFVNRTVNGLQWVEHVQTETDHYVFGRIDQKTLGVTGRFDFTFKPELTLQFYAQPFISAGSYGDFKQVNDPRAKRFQDRYDLLEASLVDGSYRVDLDGDGGTESFENPDFNFQQFRSTVVLRWEYRPGSLLYLVWSQGRDNFTGNGAFNFGSDLSDLFNQDAENVFMLKLSYWITP
jgi:hypothetical protein